MFVKRYAMCSKIQCLVVKVQPYAVAPFFKSAVQWLLPESVFDFFMKEKCVELPSIVWDGQ